MSFREIFGMSGGSGPGETIYSLREEREGALHLIPMSNGDPRPRVLNQAGIDLHKSRGPYTDLLTHPAASTGLTFRHSRPPPPSPPRGTCSSLMFNRRCWHRNRSGDARAVHLLRPRARLPLPGQESPGPDHTGNVSLATTRMVLDVQDGPDKQVYQTPRPK